MKKESTDESGVIRRVKNWFPDREFFMRSEGQVRFITISSRFQIVAASLATFTVIASAVLFGVAGWTQSRQF